MEYRWIFFSELVNEIKNTGNFNILNCEHPISFFKKRKDYKDKEKYGIKKSDYEKYLFVSHKIANNNQPLLNYEFEKDMLPCFIPRYYPSDYISIISTLCILEDFDFNFTKYIISVLKPIIDDKDLIPKLLFSLYLLTYYEIGQWKESDINFQENIRFAEKRKKKVKRILNNRNDFIKEYNKFCKEKIYYQKRAWCSLRDYFKSKEFNGYFRKSLKNEKYRYRNRLKDPILLPYFELPGDVWNNNPKFRECIVNILKNTKYENDKIPLPKLLRRICTQENITSGYPEQFDITFDLVPRMCIPENCSFCPYGLLNGEAAEFDKVCVNDTNKYCLIALISCNYKIRCKGKNCDLLNISRMFK